MCRAGGRDSHSLLKSSLLSVRTGVVVALARIASAPAISTAARAMPISIGDGEIAKGLRRRERGNSLRANAAELAERGYVNVNGKRYSAASVVSMLGA